MNTRHNTVNWIAAGLIGLFFIAGIWIIFDGAKSKKAMEGNSRNLVATDTQVVAQSVPEEIIANNGASGTFESDPVEVSPANLDRDIQPVSDKESFDAKGDLSLLDTSKNKPAPQAPTTPASSPNARVASPPFTGPSTESPPSSDPSIARWHLIYGSYSTRDAANVAEKQLKDQGYTTTLLQPPSGKDGPYRISIFNNTERGKVEAFQGAFKGSTGNDTWILKN
jgi:cell division septation protein DedD